MRLRAEIKGAEPSRSLGSAPPRASTACLPVLRPRGTLVRLLNAAASNRSPSAASELSASRQCPLLSIKLFVPRLQYGTCFAKILLLRIFLSFCEHRATACFVVRLPPTAAGSGSENTARLAVGGMECVTGGAGEEKVGVLAVRAFLSVYKQTLRVFNNERSVRARTCHQDFPSYRCGRCLRRTASTSIQEISHGGYLTPSERVDDSIPTALLCTYHQTTIIYAVFRSEWE